MIPRNILIPTSPSFLLTNDPLFLKITALLLFLIFSPFKILPSDMNQSFNKLSLAFTSYTSNSPSPTIYGSPNIHAPRVLSVIRAYVINIHFWCTTDILPYIFSQKSIKIFVIKLGKIKLFLSQYSCMAFHQSRAICINMQHVTLLFDVQIYYVFISRQQKYAFKAHFCIYLFLFI